MEHPYRALVPRASTRVVVAETGRPPTRGIRVRAWSDGTTRVRLGSTSLLIARLVWGTATALLGAGLFVPMAENEFVFMVALTTVAALLTIRTLRGETIVITPAAISRRRRFHRSQVHALVDVSTVVVSGDGKQARLDLQCGRKRTPLADALGYDEATLRWIAQRLRRAIEAAR